MYRLKHPTSKLDWKEYTYKETVFVKGGIATCKEETTFNYLRNLGFIPIEEDSSKSEETIGGVENDILGEIGKGGEAGLTLPEIADKLGTHYVRLARPIKNLVKGGLVAKDDKRYYPTKQAQV